MENKISNKEYYINYKNNLTCLMEEVNNVNKDCICLRFFYRKIVGVV